MLFSSVTFGFALFSYAFQTYAKLSEETMKYIQEKTEAATKAAANAAKGELGDLTDKLSVPGMMGDLTDKLSVTKMIPKKIPIAGFNSPKSPTAVETEI